MHFTYDNFKEKDICTESKNGRLITGVGTLLQIFVFQMKNSGSRITGPLIFV